MKKAEVAILAMAMLMVCATIAPAFAAPQQKGAFTQVVITLGSGSEKEWLTGDILHARGGAGIAYLYGAPFPLGNSESAAYTTGGQLNLVDLTGSYVGHTTYDNFAAGTMVGTFINKFTGVGLYVYKGPTFTFTLGGRTATLTQGQALGGVLFEIQNYRKHGIGDLTGFVTKGEGTSVLIYGPLSSGLVGFTLSVVTGTYSGP